METTEWEGCGSFFFFSSRRRHTIWNCDWSSDVCSSDLQVFGHTLRINPILVIFALLFGLEVHGIIGALVALPILSVLRETTMYLRRHITFEDRKSACRERVEISAAVVSVKKIKTDTIRL